MTGQEAAEVRYEIPVGAGKLELVLAVPLNSPDAMRAFVLDLLDRVGRLAAHLADPPARPPAAACEVRWWPFDPANLPGTAPPQKGLHWIWQRVLTVWSAGIGVWDGQTWRAMPHNEPRLVAFWAPLEVPAAPPVLVDEQ